ncbi:MAG: hypothetical protein IE878_03445 [Epsilonproteobacteria bacterium]|nr:hypothetical protein [Campylobacterota bacterium]
MATPRGFGKKSYFRLVSIQAFSATQALNSQTSSTKKKALFVQTATKEDSDLPPKECQTILFVGADTPCHCCKIFTKRAKAALKSTKLVPKSSCNCRFFSYRRSGVHPPKENRTQ